MLTADIAQLIDESNDNISLELSNQRSLVQARVAQPGSRGLLSRQRRAARAAVPEPDSADARLAAGLRHRAFGHLLAADQVGGRLDERLKQRRHAVQMRAVRIRGVAVRVVTDYGGSCNGAKIRFSPQKDWPGNASLAKTPKTLSALEPVKKSHPTLSTAHDDDDDVAHGDHCRVVVHAQGQNLRVVGIRAVTQEVDGHVVAQQKILDYSSSFSNGSLTLSNEFFQALLNKTWTEVSEKELQGGGCS
ncbi:hypothetical protein PR001_g3586 [Phytophthora rubi]|uniref:Uncharacterized protein n=1 Tax=Phytophthora rubi TaxID=129364 RepID=A0A6A3NQN4_9STRA|nr:hypothetical protein PR002_g3693 [Phytophthora rubi]KAE9049010.1 hypothetical protein PR001_g3586 [Phytophthora rubi]